MPHSTYMRNIISVAPQRTLQFNFKSCLSLFLKEGYLMILRTRKKVKWLLKSSKNYDCRNYGIINPMLMFVVICTIPSQWPIALTLSVTLITIVLLTRRRSFYTPEKYRDVRHVSRRRHFNRKEFYYL